MLRTDKITTLLWKKIRELQQQVNEPADAVWGNITGTLSNQTDLQNTLNSKENLLPDKSGKAGKFLKVNTVETGYEWADAGSSFSGTLDDIPDGATYKRVTQTEKNTWNNKSDFSGSYIDLTDIPNEFNPSAHNHPISEVTNLQTALDGKANSSHNHAISDITNLQITLDGKASVNHTHAINETTGLQTALDSKANSTHSHNKSDITDFAHQSNHQSGGSDALTGNLDAVARILLKKANVNIGSRRAINFIDGSNITINAVDDSINEKVDITINASGGGGGVIYAQRTLTADETKVNDTSVQNWFASDNRLLLDANSIYEFEGTFVSLNGTTSHGLNMQFDAITGATIRWTAIGAKVTETTQATALRFTMTNTFNTNRNVTTASTVGGNLVWISGLIITGASSGYFSPKVAQTAASGSFVVKAGTYMKVRKVGINTDTNIGGWTT